MPEPDLLTVQEAAEALSVSAPRLRRLLARPEWSQRTETRTRQTRTGTRTATVLNRSLLPELRESLETSGAPSLTIEPERERDATGTGTDRNENENAPDWKTRALIAESDRDAWKAQAEKALQLADQAQRLQLAAQHRVAELEGKLLPAMEQKEPAATPSASQSSPEAPGGVIAPPETEKRGIWSFLRRWW